MKILHITRSITPQSGGVIESIKLKNILYKELKLKCEIATLDKLSKKLLLDKRLPLVNFLGISKNPLINYFNFNLIDINIVWNEKIGVDALILEKVSKALIESNVLCLWVSGKYLIIKGKA